MSKKEDTWYNRIFGGDEKKNSKTERKPSSKNRPKSRSDARRRSPSPVSKRRKHSNQKTISKAVSSKSLSSSVSKKWYHSIFGEPKKGDSTVASPDRPTSRKITRQRSPSPSGRHQKSINRTTRPKTAPLKSSSSSNKDKWYHRIFGGSKEKSKVPSNSRPKSVNFDRKKSPSPVGRRKTSSRRTGRQTVTPKSSPSTKEKWYHRIFGNSKVAAADATSKPKSRGEARPASMSRRRSPSPGRSGSRSRPASAASRVPSARKKKPSSSESSKWRTLCCNASTVSDSSSKKNTKPKRKKKTSNSKKSKSAKRRKQKQPTSNRPKLEPLIRTLEIQVVCPTEQNLKWRPKHVEDGSPLRLVSINDYWWSSWGGVLHSEPLTFIFGLKHSGSNSYSFVQCLKGNGKIKLKLGPGKVPNKTYLTEKDNRVFRYVRLRHTKFHMMQHVATGLFVASRDSKLILVGKDEADDWLLEQKIF